MAHALLLFVVLGCVYQVYPLTVQDVEKDFLNYLMFAVQKPVMKDAKEEVKYSLVPNSKGCWAKCSNKGGLCESICGKHGYCCRKGYRDCVNELAALNPTAKHACVRPNHYKPWYCAVSVYGVKKTSTDLKTAQEALGKGSSRSRQAIIPMNGQVALDPHALAKGWGKGSMWWWGWGDIDNMRGKCEKAEMPKAAPKPVDGGFSSWGNYGPCSKACGKGDQTRSRQCNKPLPSNGGKACAGASSETRKCDVKSCQGRKSGTFYWKELSACDESKDIIKDSATCKLIQNSRQFGTGPFGSVAESYSLPLGCSYDGSKWHFNNLKNKAVCSSTFKCICLRQ